MEKIIRLLTLLAFLPFAVSCNIYAPLTGNSSEQDHLEEARKCLHESNFTCAIAEYEKLADGSLKKQKLCTAHLSRMGFTLSNLINTVSEQTDKVLGNLANNLGAWTEEKYTSAEAAKEQCVAFQGEADSGDLGVLLKTISLFAHCANLISKADQIQGVTDDITEECTTSNSASNGTVTNADIGPSSGAASAGAPAMCAKDVDVCRQDIIAIDPSQLGDSKLSDIQGAYDQIPDELTQSGAAVTALRQALRSVVSN